MKLKIKKKKKVILYCVENFLWKFIISLVSIKVFKHKLFDFKIILTKIKFCENKEKLKSICRKP